MKLFRKFRQQLIKQGNFKKYFFYAVGEILLVMIGISLAFQVDNWNEDRVKKKSEIRYYENIRDQIADDKNLIEAQLQDNNFYRDQFKYAEKIVETNDKTKMDTLGIIIRNLTNYSDLDRQGNIYETLVNSGEIKIIRNHTIVNGIRDLEEKYMYMNRMENIHYDAMMNHVVGAINPIIKYATAEIIKPELVFNYEFQNLVTILMQIMKEKDKVYHEALAEIDSVTQLINQELLNL